MKAKILTYAALTIIGTALIGGVASAHSFGGMWFGSFGINPEELTQRYQQMFENKAKILGISVDEVKNAWADGKTMDQLIKEKGLNLEEIQSRAKELHLQQIKSQLQTLVSKGIITQAQADKKLQLLQNQQNNLSRFGMNKMMKKSFGWLRF